jgi:hypothetical protein
VSRRRRVPRKRLERAAGRFADPHLAEVGPAGRYVMSIRGAGLDGFLAVGHGPLALSRAGRTARCACGKAARLHEHRRPSGVVVP